MVQEKSSANRQELELVGKKGLIKGAIYGASTFLSAAFILNKTWSGYRHVHFPLKAMIFAGVTSGAAILKADLDMNEFNRKKYGATSPLPINDSDAPFMLKYKYPILVVSPIAIGILSWRASNKPGFTATDKFYNMRLITQGCMIGILMAIAIAKQSYSNKKKKN